jgi:hypothetical protein
MVFERKINVTSVFSVAAATEEVAVTGSATNLLSTGFV